MHQLLCCLALGLTIFRADGVKNCCAPAQWESDDMIFETHVVNGSTEFTNRVERMIVDTTIKMMAFLATITKNGNTTHVHIIQDFNARTEYRLYGNPPNLCLQEPLAPWSDLCVPENATLVSSGYRGGASRLAVDTYRFEYRGELTYFMTVAHADCAPVDVSVYGTLENIPRMITKTYSNLTPRIRDRSVFNVPVFCHHG